MQFRLGVWLGVDWDDPGRGKHDGSYKNVRYFAARYDMDGKKMPKRTYSVFRLVLPQAGPSSARIRFNLV